MKSFIMAAILAMASTAYAGVLTPSTIIKLPIPIKRINCASANSSANSSSNSSVKVNVDNVPGSTWINDVWRQNGQVTPWCPQPLVPANAYSFPNARGKTPAERPISIYVDGIKYILEN